MIPKRFRLQEKEVKKVLQRGKPFFSYGIVLNKLISLSPYNRFAIVIGGKSVAGSVERNYFRRLFYTLMETYIGVEVEKGMDIVFVVKKQKRLDKNDQNSINEFKKDIHFLLKHIFSKL